MTVYILKEDGDKLLQETGDNIELNEAEAKTARRKKRILNKFF